MRIILITFICLFVILTSASAQPADMPPWQHGAQSIIGALDYVAIDYPQAVHEGRIVDDFEYAEQREFLTTVTDLLGNLPERPAQSQLLSDAAALTTMIEKLAPPNAVADSARALAANLVAAYDVVITPRRIPTPRAMAPLYATQCAACHGAEGRGNGPAGLALDPPPTDFLNSSRARNRSLYGLYTTISLGVSGTGMAPFSHLSESERWSLAFYVAGLGDDADTVAKGQRHWADGILADEVSSLATLTSRSPAVVAQNDPMSLSVLAFLRQHPEVLKASAMTPIDRAISDLDAAVSAYRANDAELALQKTLSAYLAGYELVEAPLRALDNEFAIGIERDMQVVRNRIRQNVAIEDFEADVLQLRAKLAAANTLLNDRGSSWTTLYISAFLILLREGLEAILLLAAISLYLRRAAHPTAMRYVHIGWVSAIATGAVIWVALKTVIELGGVQREVVEGIAALLAAFVLLYVGMWLHRHSGAAQWQAFLTRHLGSNLSAGTLWGVAALSFVAVFREVLETILFFETLWLQSGKMTPLLFGSASAAVSLLVVGWLVFFIGARLPLRQFFQANGVLMFVLALVFAGKGVAALQEAGIISATFIAMPRIDWLGIHPTLQTIGAQLSILVVSAVWLLFRSTKPASSAG